MTPSLAYFFSEIMQQYYRLFGRTQQTSETEIVRMARLDMEHLVGVLCAESDDIKNNESTRQAIIEVAAGCFKMLEIIGDHPVDRLARELDVSRLYAAEICRVVAASKSGVPTAFVDCCDDMEMEKRMIKRIKQAFKKEIKTPDQK